MTAYDMADEDARIMASAERVSRMIDAACRDRAILRGPHERFVAGLDAELRNAQQRYQAALQRASTESERARERPGVRPRPAFRPKTCEHPE
jgi:hypothetical protein